MGRKRKYHSEEDYKIAQKSYNEKNYLRILESNRDSYHKNKETRKKRTKKWRDNNLDKLKEYNIKNKPKQREYQKQKLLNDLNYKISMNLRVRFSQILKKKKINKNNSVINLLGCSISEYIKHIESQLLPELNWNNYGKLWEIDHIIPCSSFDLTIPEEQEKCFHYTNLQPLFKTTKIAESFGYTNQIGNRNKLNNT